MAKNKKYLVKGTRKTERGLGTSSDIIVAKSWNKADKKARSMGWGVKSDYNLSLVRDKRRNKKSKK